MAEGQAHGPTGEAGEWLNITQAARRLGWPRERLRSLARRGKLPTRRMNTGELLIQIGPELVAQAQAEPPPTSGLAHGSTHRLADGPDDADPWVDPEADRLRDRAAALEASLAEATDRTAGLRVEVARAEERARAAAAVATADVEAAKRVAEEAIAANGELLAELRRSLEHERARAERLEAMLNRPPFWVRWFTIRR